MTTEGPKDDKENITNAPEAATTGAKSPVPPPPPGPPNAAPPPPPPTGAAPGLVRKVAKSNTDDPIASIKRKLMNISRTIGERETVRLSEEDKKKYNPDSGLCKTNGNEIELRSLKQVIFWSQNSDNRVRITHDEMKKLSQAHQRYEKLRINIDSETQALVNALNNSDINFIEADRLFKNIENLSKPFINAHKDLVDTMNGVRKSALARAKEQGPELYGLYRARGISNIKEGKETPGIKILIHNFVIDYQVEQRHGKELPGDNIKEKIMLYILNQSKSNENTETSIQASLLVQELGGENTFKENFLGNLKDPKQKYGLVKDSFVSGLITDAEKIITPKNDRDRKGPKNST